MAFDIQFVGAAGTVTGSKYLVSANGTNILVDCGLFQGLKSLRLQNWDGFPINPRDIHAVILTHAHIDHSGYIPRLIKNGFRGSVFSTAATRDVCKILLPDCGYLLEEEAAYLNKLGRTKHHPALPLFTLREAEDSLKYFDDVPFREKHQIKPGLEFEFRYAGHILGAASVVLHVNGRKIAFTGDVGRMNDEMFSAPEILPEVDYLVTESTYGNRVHPSAPPMDELEKVVNRTIERHGVVLIPAFAVGRAQSLMYFLSLLRRQNRIPDFPMYLNSPMATDFTAIFAKYKDLHKLSESDCHEINKSFKFVRTVEESKALNERRGPMLIISASGMLTGGRVLHHLKAFAPYAANTILLTGFQSAGTRGEALQRGAEEIKVHGEYIRVNAHVAVLDNMSAHADYREMIEWFGKSKMRPVKVFVTHGEASAADEFRRRLNETFGWSCFVPEQGEKVRLE